MDNMIKKIKKSIKKFKLDLSGKKVCTEAAKGNFAATPEEYFNSSLYFEIKTFLHGLLTIGNKN